MPRHCAASALVWLTAAIAMAGLLAACARPLQRLETTALDSAAMGRPLSAAVYLPPTGSWDRTAKLPLVVFLHGGGDDYASLEQRGATAVFDTWIAAGKLRPFIMVAPDGEMGFWSNWYDGSRRYEDWVVQDVIPWVRKTYPVSTARADTHLMGISMGGSGTMFMALQHRDLFASAAVISAPLYADEQVLELLDSWLWRRFFRADRVFGPAEPDHVATKSLYRRVRSAEDLQGLELLIGYGREDSDMIRESSAAYHRHLVEHGVPHRTLIYDGEHSWHDWNRVFPAVLCRHLQGDGCRLASDPFYELREFD